MSKSQRSKILFCSLFHPGLDMFISSGFAQWQLCLLFHWDFALFQVPGDNEKHWKPVLVVLTEKDLLIYESMPRMKEAWFSPLHTYPLLATRYLRFFITTASRVVGTAESARNRYSWCTATYHAWNVVVWETDSSSMGRYAQLNSSLLFRFKFWPRLMARSTPEGLRTWPFGLDPEAGVLKKLRARSPEIVISVCRPEGLAEALRFPAAPPGWKTWNCCPELDVLVWQFCTTGLGLLGTCTCDGDT